MQIWQGMLILENVYQDIYSPLQREQSHGNPNFSSVLPCLPLKQSILQSLKVAKKLCGWRISYKSWVWSKTILLCTAIVRVSFIWQRIRHTIQNPSILMWDIIGYETCLKKNSCSLRRYTQWRIGQIWWQIHYPRRSLKAVCRKRAWRCLSNDLEGEIYWVHLIWGPKSPTFKKAWMKITIL